VNCVDVRRNVKRGVKLAIVGTSALVAVWIAQAFVIVLVSHARLRHVYDRYHETNPSIAEREKMTVSELRLFRSAGPLLKKPFRRDVRLYYGEFGWASKETGQWEVKTQ